jgi:transcriptional regulator of acetoin/glycerol metabolism
MLDPKQNETDGEPFGSDAVELHHPPSQEPMLNRDERDRIAVMRALHQSSGRVDEAARILGIGRTTLYRKRRKYGLL